MNLYLYIPYNSFHTDAMKRSFIQTELMRYIRNSSDRRGLLATSRDYSTSDSGTADTRTHSCSRFQQHLLR